ncbi:hypothetical protein Tsubulata_011233 [Turnera subulata]|uniref:Uncharacterized protein n=1 Tax=Turnera subulata TaxID=218843 RepID=A0A9Q0FP10_9ROSI|nr:hypothetical protein Tsubulata_011233 [Turnera subulata]
MREPLCSTLAEQIVQSLRHSLERGTCQSKSKWTWTGLAWTGLVTVTGIVLSPHLLTGDATSRPAPASPFLRARTRQATTTAAAATGLAPRLHRRLALPAAAFVLLAPRQRLLSGTYSRVKAHLLQLRNHGIAICKKVSRGSWLEALTEGGGHRCINDAEWKETREEEEDDEKAVRRRRGWRTIGRRRRTKRRETVADGILGEREELTFVESRVRVDESSALGDRSFA